MQGSPRIDELRQKFHENPRRYFAPLANEYRKAGDPEQAIAICRAHLAQQPGHMSGHVVYGQALYDARRPDEARAVFENALSLDPDNAIVLRQLGDIARESGDSAEARHWYGKALDLDPQNSEVAAYIAELAEPLTGPEVMQEVADDAEKAIVAATQSEEQEDGADSVSVAAEESEEPDSDDVAWRKTPRPEESPFVTRTMAELYARQGHREAALDVYRQLAIHHPDDEEIRGRIEELSAEPIFPPSGEDLNFANDAVPPLDPGTHFTEIELSAGDSWDSDSWGAGSTPEEPMELDFDTTDAVESVEVAPDATGVVAYSPEPPPDEELSHFTPKPPTVREFFATLGARRPPSRDARQSYTARAAIPGGSRGISGDDASRDTDETVKQDELLLATEAFANLFPESAVSEEDSRAAFALSGALSSTAHSPVPSTVQTSPPHPSPAVTAQTPGQNQESEEDLRHFREWLDGLAES